jgi:hypothetical protein
MLPTKCRFIWSNGFRGEELKKSANRKQESPVAAMFVNGSGRNQQSLQRTFHRCFLPSFGSFGRAVLEEKIFKMWRPCLLTDQDEMSKLYRGTSIDASYQVLVHLAKGFQSRLKCEKLTDNRQRTPSDGKSPHCLWQGELIQTSLQRTFHRCFLPSVGSFCQTVSEKNNFKNQPIRNKDRMWRPCLLTDRVEMSNIYKGPPIDASYQISFQLAKRFQRRIFV